MAPTFLYVLPIALVLYIVSRTIYRLYLHPLARFPGPSLTAATLAYEFYYDVILRGQFTFELARMHEQYGPIVRINPHELSISDRNFYDTLYVSAATRRTDKYYWSARMFGIVRSSAATVGHDEHRMRRQPLNQFFSKASVLKLEPMMKAKITRLCERIEAFAGTGLPVQLDAAYHCLLTDIITEYAVGKPVGFLEREDFVPEWVRVQQGALETSLLQKQTGWLLGLLQSLPVWLVNMMNPDMTSFRVMEETTRSQIRRVIEERKGMKKGEKQNNETWNIRTIVHELLDSDMSDSEKSFERLSEEIQTVIMAGITTTGYFFTATTYHILANPSILARLQEELKTAMPDPGSIPSSTDLEKLPYLTAVINEGFRITYGISARLTRISPDQPLQYQEWTIPAGTPVGMTAYMLHRDPELFPDPDTFEPDRFLDEGAQLAKHLVTFSKGSRACLGMNLARADIYLGLATVIRRCGSMMEFFETDRSAVDLKHEFFSPVAEAGSKGLRVTVRNAQ